jgi:hypothetical protein
MTETQAYLQQQDVYHLFIIFAVLACVIPIYEGFKKSTARGLINTSIVGGILSFYYLVPEARFYITVVFMVWVMAGILVGTKQTLFP